MNSALLPLDHRGLTRRETADLLRGLAELIDSYPHDGFVVTLDIVPAATGTTRPKRAGKTTKSS
ncbi:MAG: hypothetical protein OWS74_08190 [Firmicutes bacterium]|nr:hypothetical protein [Bacillota bacterium]